MKNIPHFTYFDSIQNTRIYNRFLSRGLTALAKVQFRERVTVVTVTAWTRV